MNQIIIKTKNGEVVSVKSDLSDKNVAQKIAQLAEDDGDARISNDVEFGMFDDGMREMKVQTFRIAQDKFEQLHDDVLEMETDLEY